MNKKDFLFKFLPKSIRDQVKMDEEALFSVTDQLTADKITNDLSKFISSDDIITDGTACVGGNTFSFSRTFGHVNAVELDKQRYEFLRHNMNILGADNVVCYHGDIMNLINRLDQSMVFLDAPWGGPCYKSQALVDLFLSNIPLSEVCRTFTARTKYIALKTPINFDIESFLRTTAPYMRLVHKNIRLRKLHLYIFESISHAKISVHIS